MDARTLITFGDAVTYALGLRRNAFAGTQHLATVTENGAVGLIAQATVSSGKWRTMETIHFVLRNYQPSAPMELHST